MGKKWIVAVIVGLMTNATWAGPVGPEFLANTSTGSSQFDSHVTISESGNFVIVWKNAVGGCVNAQRYDASGTPQGGEFKVNTDDTASVSSPCVSMDSSGNFVVVWDSHGNDWGVFAQRYNASGLMLGDIILVNTSEKDTSWMDPSVSMNGSGNFVVVWSNNLQSGSGDDIFGQRYDASGIAQGSEFQINTYTTDSQLQPSVCMNSNGDFVVSWSSVGQDGDDTGVYAQRYNALGVAQGEEFQVNSYTVGHQNFPSVGMDDLGNFVIVWQSASQDGDLNGVYGKRYDASGTALGGEFLVNSYILWSQSIPCIGMNTLGSFVVVWHSYGQDGDGLGIYGQKYYASGIPYGNEFQVNTYTVSDQDFPVVGINSSGNFVVSWTSEDQDGDAFGIYAQRFEPDLSVSTITTTTSSITEGGTLGFDVTFSESVTGVDTTDFALFTTGDISGATILSVTGSGSEYTVLVADVDGDGTLRLDLLDDDSIIDGGGNPLGGVGVGNGDFTGGESYTVVPELSLTVWPLILLLLLIGIMVLFRKSRIILG